MKRMIFLLNKTYISFFYVISFLSFLSFQVKILSLSEFYNVIMQSTVLAYSIFIALSVISIFFTRLLIRLLQKIQQLQ